MRKSFLTIIVLFIAVCSAGARHKKQKIKKTAIVKSNIQSIYMHHTACFGKCPDYIVEVKNDGTVKYYGRYFVEDTGVFEKHFSLEKVKTLFDEFSMYKVDTCQDNYFNKIPDVSGLIYKISYKNKIKEIHNAHFGPDFLIDLSKSVDSFSHVDKTWRKLPEILKR